MGQNPLKPARQEDLAQSSYHDWLDTVHLAYAAVKTCCRKVVLGGFSTGAGLVLHMVAGGVPAAGVVAVCPPMRLQDLSSRLVPAVDVWNRFMKMVHIDRAQMAFVDNHPENPHINDHRNPIAGVRELDRLMDDLAPRLDAVTVPALVVQSHGDPVVNPAGSKKLFDQLGSADKTYLLVNQPRHGILLGDGADRIYRAINDFIHRLHD